MADGPTISLHCPECTADFEKRQRELNLYGVWIECPNCHRSFDCKDQLRREE